MLGRDLAARQAGTPVVKLILKHPVMDAGYRRKETGSIALKDVLPQASLLIVASLVLVGVLVVLLVVHRQRRSKRDTQHESAGRTNPNKFDTTLGEFHDMREALRPLQHTRVASRSVPRSQS